MLLYEMKFLVPNYSCLQNPWLRGYRPQIPVLSVLNWICWTPPPLRKQFLGMPLTKIIQGGKLKIVTIRCKNYGYQTKYFEGRFIIHMFRHEIPQLHQLARLFLFPKPLNSFGLHSRMGGGVGCAYICFMFRSNKTAHEYSIHRTKMYRL